VRSGGIPAHPHWHFSICRRGTQKPSGEKAGADFLKDFKDAELAELKKLSKKIGEALERASRRKEKEKMMCFAN